MSLFSQFLWSFTFILFGAAAIASAYQTRTERGILFCYWQAALPGLRKGRTRSLQRTSDVPVRFEAGGPEADLIANSFASGRISRCFGVAEQQRSDFHSWREWQRSSTRCFAAAASLPV